MESPEGRFSGSRQRHAWPRRLSYRRKWPGSDPANPLINHPRVIGLINLVETRVIGFFLVGSDGSGSHCLPD